MLFNYNIYPLQMREVVHGFPSICKPSIEICSVCTKWHATSIRAARSRFSGHIAVAVLPIPEHGMGPQLPDQARAKQENSDTKYSNPSTT